MTAFKTLLYMGSMHGFFTYYFPCQLALVDTLFINIGYTNLLAWPFWIMGTLIIVWCSLDFISKGHGTPAHIDPPKELLVNGLYHYVRNPIYLGALLVQIGSVIWFASRFIIIYSLLFFLAFHMLVVFIEEPVLKRKFGAAYAEYTKRVSRWIPCLHKTYL